MRTTIIIGIAVLGCAASPAAAQYYSAPAYTYTAPQPYVYTTAPPAQDYDGDDWVRDCREDMRDRRRDDDWRDCDQWQDRYEDIRSGGYGYQTGGAYDGYAGYGDYRDRGGYSYGYPAGGSYRYGSGGGYYGGGYSGGYSGGSYAAASGGGTITTQSGGVLVIVEQEHATRYVPVIREEIIEETYEVEETEIVRERVVRQVPVKTRRQPQREKYIKYTKGN